MQDSNGNNEVKKGAEDAVVKTMQPDIERIETLLGFAKMAHRIYKESGIHPTDYKTVDGYIAAVLSRTTTECRTGVDGLDDPQSIGPLVKAELKKRGEF